MACFSVSSQALRCWVLLWLAFSWSIALASPPLVMQGMTEVCTSHGMVWVNADGEPVEPTASAFDCDLCLPATLPAPVARPSFIETRPQQTPPSHAGLHLPVSPAAMPPPARGPPPFSFQPQEVSS